MISIAVILAAGLGSRLKERTQDKPKGLLDVGEMSLIQRSIETLHREGITDIYIGTGYLAEKYEEFSLSYEGVRCIKNEEYEKTGSMHTLYCMRQQIKEDFLLLESDLIYEPRAVSILLNDTFSNSILASNQTGDHDEVYIETDDQLNLVQMSKNIRELTKAHGVLVGISKLNFDRFHDVCKIYEEQGDCSVDYEDIMVLSSKLSGLHVNKIDDLIWGEIDDEIHLDKVLTEILPRIS